MTSFLIPTKQDFNTVGSEFATLTLSNWAYHLLPNGIKKLPLQVILREL